MGLFVAPPPPLLVASGCPAGSKLGTAGVIEAVEEAGEATTAESPKVTGFRAKRPNPLMV